MTKRTKKAKIENFNCAGYVFDFPAWLFAYSHLMHKDLNEAGEYVLSALKLEGAEYNFQIIKEEDIQNVEFLNHDILMRFSSKDFHFMKRGANGSWYHKPGGMRIRRIKKEKVFSQQWPHSSYPYTGDYGLFRKK